MERIIKKIEEPYLKTRLPIIEPGDTVKVVTKVIEGDKSRLQAFEGVVISVQGEGLGKTVKVRKISYGIGVERTFPVHSPNVDSFEIIKKGSPRRAKLYYLRDRVGKRALKVKTGKKKVQYDELIAIPEEVTPENIEEMAPVKTSKKDLEGTEKGSKEDLGSENNKTVIVNDTNDTSSESPQISSPVQGTGKTSHTVDVNESKS